MGILIAYVLGVLSALPRKNEYRKNTNSESNKNECHSLPNFPIPIVSIPPTKTDQEKAEQKKKNRRKSIKFWAEIGGVAVLIFYTAFTYNIMRANLRAAKAANDTLGEIQQQTKLMRQQVVGSQEAVIEVVVSYGDGPQELNVQLINNGHVTATGIRLRVDASQQKIRDGTPIVAPFHFEPDVQPIAPGKAFVRSWTLPFRLTEKERQQGGYLAPDWPGIRTFIFRAEAVYDNGFGDERKQSSCRQWLPGFSITLPNGSSQGGGGGAPYVCENIQTVIRSVLEQAHRTPR